MLYNKEEYELVNLPPHAKKELFGNTDKRLRMTKIGIKSITALKQSLELAEYIYNSLGIFDRKLDLIDANSGLGGNLIGFLYNNKRYNVVGIEYDVNNYTTLRHNMKILFPNFTSIYNKNCFDLIEELTKKADVIFLDPPWNLGNFDVINHNTIGYGDITTEEAINLCLEKTDVVFLKTSRNDLLELYDVDCDRKFCTAFYNYKIMCFTNKTDIKLVPFYNKNKFPFKYDKYLA